MDSPARPHSVLRFGAFELDDAAGELREDGIARRLPAQPFRVLVLLAGRAGELVTRDEIQRYLWGDRNYLRVDHRINFCVNQIRAALRDPAEHSQYIKTVPRRGYRFVAAITRVAADEHRRPPIGTTPADDESRSQVSRTAPTPSDAVGKGDSFSLTRFPGARRFSFAAMLLFALLVLPSGERRADPPRTAALTPKDSIVVADFTNTTGDKVFDEALTQALLIEFRQSPFLNVLPDAQVRETLKMMARPANQRITPEVARDLCARTGSSTILDGTISAIGGHYLLSVDAIACSTGETLASERGEAVGKEDVLPALGRAASRLRTALGESLPSVQKFEVPASATTTSLEALKSYSVGLRVILAQGDAPGIPLLKRALELDPRFALAYAKLAGVYSNLDQPTSALEYETKAFELRDSVTERERLVISALYFRLTGEVEKSTQTLEMWKSEYPHDPGPRGSLGVNYVYMGQYLRAATEWEEALRLAPDEVQMYENLATVYLALNRVDKAQAVADAGIAHHLESGRLSRTLYGLAFLRRDRVEMDRQAEWAVGKPGAEDFLLAAQSDTEAYFGRIGNSRRLSNQAVDSATRSGLPEAAALWKVIAALTEAEFGERGAAINDVANALTHSAGRNVKVLAALTLARAGEAAKAEAIATELETNYPKNTVFMLFRLPSIKAAIALARNDPSSALTFLESARHSELGQPTPSGFAPLYPVYLRGQAYLMLHNGPAATAEFHKILDNPGIVLNFPLGALARLQLARAAKLGVDRTAARDAYGEFLASWKDADSDVPVLIAARAELAQLLDQQAARFDAARR
jgi:DNA-binding winged helix-turn-helix (wHTH) protein/tetratricopeptide (TPR) repeat protein